MHTQHCPWSSPWGRGWIRYSVVEGTRYFVARCLQLLFPFGHIKLCCGFLRPLQLFSLISLFGFFLYCDSVLHRAGKWHLQTACCRIAAASIGNLKAEAGAGNSILPLVWFTECQPSAEEWGGEENWFVTKILDRLIFAVLQTVVWRLHKLILNLVDLRRLQCGWGIVLDVKLGLRTTVLFVWWP